MLGTLDDDQALSLIEALVAADGERVMALVNAAPPAALSGKRCWLRCRACCTALRWFSFPSALGADMAAIELRMRELARTVPPADVQLYYQTLLIGRKELPYAPDRRMGVEMTLLRALAFHPRCRCRKRRRLFRAGATAVIRCRPRSGATAAAARSRFAAVDHQPVLARSQLQRAREQPKQK
jgi:DNA polymerase-3 subunit gamma/tau